MDLLQAGAARAGRTAMAMLICFLPGLASAADEASWLRLDQAQQERELRLRRSQTEEGGKAEDKSWQVREQRQLDELNLRQRQRVQATSRVETRSGAGADAANPLRSQQFGAEQRDLELQQRIQGRAMGVTGR